MKSEWFKRWDDDGESVDDYWAKTRDEDVKDEDDDSGWKKKKKSTSTSWWDSFHGTSKKSSYTPVKSTSAYLRSSYSGYNSFRSSGRDDLLEVLKEVNKTVNLTQNSVDGKAETDLVVRYSDGRVGNSLTNSTLFVSPNIIQDSSGTVYSKDSDEYYNGLDALNGQAMLCAFMKKSVTPNATFQYENCDNWAVRNIYMTDLQTTAGNEICHDWPGFQSYIEQQQQVFQMNKEEVLQVFNSPDQNIDNFINLLCYNRLSTDRVKYSDVFEESVAKRLEAADRFINEQLDQPWHNEGRFDRANDIFATVQSMLNLDEPPPPPPEPSEGDEEEESEDSSGEGSGEGEGSEDSDGEGSGEGEGSEDSDGEGSGEGEESKDSDGKDGKDGKDSDGKDGKDSDGKDGKDSDGKDGKDSDGKDGKGKSNPSRMKINNIDTNSGSDKSRRFTGDNSYNGQAVENDNKDGSDIDPNEKIRDKQQTKVDSLKNVEDVQLNNVVYRKIIPSVNDEERTDYKTFIARSRRAINTIKDCFRFHNTDVGLSSYGLTAGGIDENSMFKVYMGENERLYERKDVVTRKKWLVSILIDQSGSMGDLVPGKSGETRQSQAAQMAIIFGEALKALNELDFSIYGFSTNGNMIDTFVYKDKEVGKMEALIEAEPHAGTGIGFHIAHVGDKMISQYGDYDNKILFVVTDGEPNCTPTPSMNGYEHTKHCCDLLRKRGIHVYGIGVANAFGSQNGDRLFGPGQFCVINDIAGTLNILVNKVRSFLQRMKK